MTNQKLLLFLCFIFPFIFKGKAIEIPTLQITKKEGLPDNAVISMYQDERGLIWVGTRNGVALYNGKNCKIYKYQKGKSDGLLYNGITQITGDNKGEIFFLTANGISVYNIRQNTFKTLSLAKIQTMYYHKSLYITYKNRIYQYDGKRFNLFYELADKHETIKSLHITDKRILLGTDRSGVFILDQNHRLSHPITKGNITNIYQDSSGKYWIGSWENGLYTIKDGIVQNFRHNDTNAESISSDFVRYFCEDHTGNIWIGTINGLDKFDISTQKFIRNFTGKNPNRNTSVWCLLCDKQGSIWAGTYFDGIYYFNIENKIYHQYPMAEHEPNGLSTTIIGCLAEDKQHNLWIGTEGGGLNCYNPTHETYQWYQHKQDPSSLSHNNVKCLYIDSQRNTLWIGTHTGGLNRMDLKTKQIKHYRHRDKDSLSIPSDIIREIIPYKDKLFIATNGGVCLFNPETEKATQMFTNSPYRIDFAAGLTLDSHGILWIYGGSYNVCAYKIKSGEQSIYKNTSKDEHSICSNNISKIYEDSKGRVWVCSTNNGIDLYQHSTNSFTNFDKEKNGLGSNNITNVCELSPDKLLFVTDMGFSILDCQNMTFSNYNSQNDLSIFMPSGNALLKASNGEIFIGGTNGLISFKENELNHKIKNYQIIPFRLFVNGKEIEAGKESSILPEDISVINKISLTHTQSIFSIEYAVTNYLPNSQSNLEYFLEGFSQQWTDTQGQRIISFTNLNPGKYILRVRPQNNNFQTEESKLEIIILPPFYRTIWAYLIYLITIGGAAYYAFRRYLKRIQTKEALKYEQERIKDIEQMSQMKLRFFTNISHEFRTPLTLIIGQVEMLLQMRSLPSAGYNRILNIYKNCQQLKELISELLDFRKQEQGYMKIKVKEHNIVDFIYKNYLLYQEYAIQKGINFSFQKTNDTMLVWYDAQQMQKVMNNLLSNAFKYTPKGERISLSLRRGNGEVIIDVNDSGNGISPQDIDKIFNRFYQGEQSENSTSGTGIGLALAKGIVELHHGKIEVYSEPGEGSTFSVHLPTGNAHFTKEQITEEQDGLQSIQADSESPKDIQWETIPEEETSNDNDENKPESQEKAKILIVEDNIEVQDMLKNIFSISYNVETAMDGKEGWKKVQEIQPDIVLSDVMMPEISGTELCRLIKNNIETCHIPVVLLTARTAIEHNLEGLQLGADDYICKPFNINILLARCNNLINNRIKLQEKFSKKIQATPQSLTTNPLDKEFMDKIMNIIMKNIENTEFNVDMLATETGVARTKLFLKIKAITGQTPHEFIQSIRLKQAAIMLKERPELNISEISDKLGFSSPRQFSKSFKGKYKVIPQAYRNS